jgi:hypothetical protein
MVLPLCVNFVLCAHTHTRVRMCTHTYTQCVAYVCAMLSPNYHFAYLFSNPQKIAYKGTKIEGDAST